MASHQSAIVIGAGFGGLTALTIVGTYRRICAGGFVSEAVYAPREAALALLGGADAGP